MEGQRSPGSFKVVDGKIACDGPRSHLFYVGQTGKADFKNFELSVDVLTEHGANSGVYFHTEFQDKGFPEKGFEAQVINVPGGEGSYRENKLSGSLYAIRNVYKPMAKDGEWFTMRVAVRGKRIEIRVNDILLVTMSSPIRRPKSPTTPPQAGSRHLRPTVPRPCQQSLLPQPQGKTAPG
jgi:hypothetical protein